MRRGGADDVFCQPKHIGRSAARYGGAGVDILFIHGLGDAASVEDAFDISEFQKRIIKNSGSAGTILPFGAALYGSDGAKWEQYIKDKEPGYGYDLAAAKQYLASSAYPNGFSCDLIVSENSLVNQRALYIQESLKALNITVNIKKMSGDEQDTYQMGGVRDASGYRDYDMLIGGWEADYPDLNGTIETMFSSSQAGEDGYNAAAYSNPIVDNLIESQRTSMDPVKRFALQSQMMDIIVNDVPYIVFDYTFRHSALNKKYTGLAVSPAWLWVLPMQDVQLAGK